MWRFSFRFIILRGNHTKLRPCVVPAAPPPAPTPRGDLCIDPSYWFTDYRVYPPLLVITLPCSTSISHFRPILVWEASYLRFQIHPWPSNFILTSYLTIIFHLYFKIISRIIFRFVPNQSENGKYNPNLVWFSMMKKIFRISTRGSVAAAGSY